MQVRLPHSAGVLRQVCGRPVWVVRGIAVCSSKFESVSTTPPKVIIITGPTAVGKTAVGLELAKRLGGEIISADSVQVYRTLDIGSDKLPVSERCGIPHHLIDVREPCDEFSAGHFYDLAREAARDIIARGRVPIVVGGTGLYLKWFVLGRATTPKATPETTAHVDAAVLQAKATADATAQEAHGRPATDDEKWLVASELLRTWGDEEAYERIVKERMNYYRLERALCIVHQTGRRLSEMDIDTSAAVPLEFDCRCFFLYRARIQLWERIVGRIEEMVFSGLLDEAGMLLRLGLTTGATMASRAIGYRQAMTFLLGAARRERPVSGPEVATLIHEVEAGTHRLVRSQMTWFRDDASYKWVDMSDAGAQAAADAVMAQLELPEHQGGCGDSGRLTKEEQRALICYRSQLKLAARAAPMAALLAHLNTSVVPGVRERLHLHQTADTLPGATEAVAPEADQHQQHAKKSRESAVEGVPAVGGSHRGTAGAGTGCSSGEAAAPTAAATAIGLNFGAAEDVVAGAEGVGVGAALAPVLAGSTPLEPAVGRT